MGNCKIKQAAFRDCDGKVEVTGPCHDISSLPKDFVIKDEGFVTVEGAFLTREEATAQLNSDHQVQSEELNLEKKEPVNRYAFKSPQIEGKHMHFDVHNGPNRVGRLTIMATPSTDARHAGYHKIIQADVNMLHRGKGLYGKLLQMASNHVKQNGALGLVSEGHYRSEAATGAWQRMANKIKFQQVRGLEPDAPDFRLSEVDFEAETLEKVHPPFTFPKIGLADNRRETPILKEPQAISNKVKLMANASNLKYGVTDPAKAKATISTFEQRLAPNGKTKIQGLTVPSGTPANISFAKEGSGAVATKQHEDLHLMFNRVHSKYGPKAALNLSTNLFNSLPNDTKQAVSKYAQFHLANGKTHPSKFHEEHLAHLLSYLNNPTVRRFFHQKTPGHWDAQTNQLTPQGMEFDSAMKRGYQHLRQTSAKVNKNWLGGVFRKNADETWTPSQAHFDLAASYLPDHHLETPEFKAARFLANQYLPTAEEIREAMVTHEGDPVAIALAAHKVPINDETRTALSKLIQSLDQDLQKSELDVAAIPRIVEPYNESAKPLAQRIQYAFSKNEVKPVTLKGKHSKGTALANDLETNSIWMLKPGSGKISPALGVAEEKADSSNREVAFSKLAMLIGLSQYVEPAELLLLDSVPVAAIRFLDSRYKTLPQKQRSDSDFKPLEFFKRYVNNGLLFRWLVLDYLAGQADRHSSNIMINDGGLVKFIDAGSAFAGPSYNPAVDPKSFVPYYLRVFSPTKFNLLTPKERYDHMPRLSTEAEAALKAWIFNLPEGQIVKMLNEYQLNPQFVMDRLNTLKMYPGPKFEFLLKFYTNLLYVEKLNENNIRPD